MTETPAYLRRQRKNDARLTPCRRSRSGTGTPASASFRIPTIWLSVNFDLRMTAPEPGAVYRRPLIYRGSLRMPRELHGHALGHPGPDQVAHGGSTKVVRTCNDGRWLNTGPTSR